MEILIVYVVMVIYIKIVETIDNVVMKRGLHKVRLLNNTNKKRITLFHVPVLHSLYLTMMVNYHIVRYSLLD